MARKVDANSGEIALVAGVGVCSDAGNNGPAILAGLCGPVDLAIAGDGSLYVVESTSIGCAQRPNRRAAALLATSTAGSDA